MSFKINWPVIGYLSAWVIILVVLLGLAMLIIPPVDAANGTVQYYQETPQNNPLTMRAMQGDSLYLGKTYDLAGVTGLSYQFAWWSNWKIANTDCSPTKIIDIHQYKKRNSDIAVLLGPEWNTGEWYFWDPWDCNITYFNRENATTQTINRPLPNDNKLAFFIVKPRTYARPPEHNRPVLFTPIQKYESVF